MSDVETPPIVDDQPLVPMRSAGSLLDRWVEAGPEQALHRVDALVKTLEVLRAAAIRATYPSDWLIHTTRDSDGQVMRQVGYLQDCGAERAGKVFGIEVGSPIVERENHPDGTYSYHMLAEAWSKVTGERVENAEGSRWSGALFFTKSIGPDEKTDPTVVRKSAWANLHGRCVRALGGLSAVPLDVLRAAGIDITRVMMIAYEKGAKGGQSTGASVGTADVTVAFGHSSGAKPGELADKDLGWYIKAYTENVADQSKARFAKANQRVLDALLAERERRAKGAAHEAETGTTAQPVDDERPTTRGRQLGDLNTRFTDAAKGKTTPGAILRQVTKDLLGQERGNFSELSDAELDTLARVTDDVLASVAAALAKGAAK